MDSTRSSGRVTNSAGDVDKNGDLIVGCRRNQVGEFRSPEIDPGEQAELVAALLDRLPLTGGAERVVHYMAPEAVGA